MAPYGEICVRGTWVQLELFSPTIGELGFVTLITVSGIMLSKTDLSHPNDHYPHIKCDINNNTCQETDYVMIDTAISILT